MRLLYKQRFYRKYNKFHVLLHEKIMNKNVLTSSTGRGVGGGGGGGAFCNIFDLH